MSDYTFSTLAPNEFEDLCKDLLQVRLDVSLQGFTTGRDGGIDLRHAPVQGKDWVVQCKHYAGSTFSKLKAAVKTELPKLARLKPDRYVLATSRGLTPDNVDDLFAMLSPYCKSKHDIIDRTELNAVLRANKAIEQQHPKLWVTSEAVLSRVLHNDVFVQTALTRGEIERRLSFFVVTDQFHSARKRLSDERVCIISGIPGVGKTTLAEMLIIEHLTDDWELVTIRQNVSEGLQILRSHPEAKQIFYYDDFLGRISSGEKLGKNEDVVLLQLMGDVHHSPNKRFILTTREYILAQAKQQHECLNRADIEPYGFVVECDEYDEDAKARILANHLHFNNVPQEYIAALVSDRGYSKILAHKNYSPRLVESMTNRLSVGANTPDTYLASCIDLLDNPAELWEDAFRQQLSEPARQLLLTLVASGVPAGLYQLEADFEEFYGVRCQKYQWPRRTTDFEQALNELEGNFIRIQRRGDERMVEWHNPSVQDFLDRWMRAHRRDVEDLLVALRRFSQLQQLITTTPILLDTERTKKVKNLSEGVLVATTQRLCSKEELSWEELSAAILLCDAYDNAELREVVLDEINKLLAAPDFHGCYALSVTELLKLSDSRAWVPKELQVLWTQNVKAHLLSLEGEVVEDSQHLIQVTRWMISEAGAMTPTERGQFVENVKKFLDDYVWASFSPDTRQLWEGIKEEIEELQAALGCSFQAAMLHVEYKIEDAEEPEQQREPVSQKLHKAGKVQSVASIFDALLE